MAKTRKLWTRLSKGELTPLLEGSPDLAAYFEGAQTLLNWKILRQGGITRWEGTRFIAEVKDSSKDTILIPFEFSIDDAYMLEFGDTYFRVYKNKAQVQVGVSPLEVDSPFLEADLRTVHYTQSADVIFMFHPSFQQRKISRASDTSWAVTFHPGSPPPSFEADTVFDAFIGPEFTASLNNSVQVRASAAVFLAADVGRFLIAGLGRGRITTVTNANEVVMDILDDFTHIVASGEGTLTSVATAVTTTIAHSALVGDFVQLTAGPQTQEIRHVTAVPGPTSMTIDAAFSDNQSTGRTWKKIVGIASGLWALRYTPRTSLNANKSRPVGAEVAMVAVADAFRAEDIGKFIHVFGGIVEITTFTNAKTIKGTLLSEMVDSTSGDPPAAVAGNWTLEQTSWNSDTGFPRSGEFYQGRLYQASTRLQPTTFWGSRLTPQDFENYAVGAVASDAVSYTMASRRLCHIEWLAEKDRALFIGTSGAEFQAVGSGNEVTVIGGDSVPAIDRVATNGCAPIQPIVGKHTILYVDRSRRKLMAIGFDIETDGQTDKELNVGAEHITESQIRLGQLAFEERLDPRLYFCREDGVLVGMTFFPEQKVVAFTRRTTSPGTFEHAAAIPSVTGGQDQVWVMTKRTINGATKRYVEMFEPNHEGLAGRDWTSLQTDCAKVVTSLTGKTIRGLDHLEAEAVDVIKNGSFIGPHTVTSGAITLQADLIASDVVEVGLHYDSTVVTMRPAAQSIMIEGMPRSWDALFGRLYKTIGGKMNGEAIQYPPGFLDQNKVFTGDVKVTGTGWDTEGRVTVLQDQPYPMTVLALFGTLDVGETD